MAAVVHCSGAPAPPPAPSPEDKRVQLSVTIPVGSDAVVRVPLVTEVGLEPKTAVITEGSSVVWRSGAYVSGVSGISGAQADGSGVVFNVASGAYAFEATLPSALLVV